MDKGAVLLELRGITKHFGQTRAVADLDVTIYEGEVFTLLGPSGCGKTTTLRIIAGLEHPEAGQIRLKGRTIVDASARYFAPPDKRNMGMVFQSYAVWPHITVFENIAFPLRLRREPAGTIKQKVMAALELVGLPELAARYPWQLSGGQQQRIALARAVVYSPDVLLLDEPLSNLDAKLREQMRGELKALQRRLGTTFVFVTHDQTEAMSLSTRIAVMNHGRIEQLAAPDEIYERPATPFVRDFVGQSVILPGTCRNTGDGVCVELQCGARVPLKAAGPAVADGAAVAVAYRSEAIRIKLADQPGPGEVLAVVEDVSYLGNRIDYQVRLGDTSFTIHGSGERLPVGCQVCLCLGESGVTVWPNGR